MHPILRSRTALGAYLIGWALVGICFTAMARVGGAQNWVEAFLFGLPAAVVGAGLFLPAYYLCRALPLQGTPPGRLASSLSVSTLLLGAAWSAAYVLTLRQIRGLPQGVSGWKGFLNMWVLGFLLAALVLAVYYLILAQERTLEAQQKAHEQQALAREAELKALRAQLNPHFLFNSLNSISALTTLDAKRAREMCVLLADFLRKSLKLGEQPWVSLADEMDLLKAYLSIEQIRFGARLQVAWEVDPESLAQPIPPLLLQPLVENAIKHGIAQVMEGGTLRIATRRTPSLLEIQIENPVDEDAPARHSRIQGLGMGLRQVRARLLGRFGPDIRFEAGRSDGTYRVLMVFPVEPLESSHD